MRLLLSALLLIALAGVASAQEIISADRPGVTASPTVIPARRVQIEIDAQIVKDDPGTGMTATTYSVPATLIRIGLLSTMELRVGAEYRTINTGDSTDTLDQLKGIAAVSIGTKVAIAQEDGALPELGLVAQLGIPEGADAFALLYVTPTLALAARSSLNSAGTVNMYGSIGGSWDGVSGRGSGTYGLALWVAPTSSFGLFTEVDGVLTPGLPPSHTLDAGAYFLASPYLQFDLFGGVGLTDIAPDAFINIGLSVRRPF